RNSVRLPIPLSPTSHEQPRNRSHMVNYQEEEDGRSLIYFLKVCHCPQGPAEIYLENGNQQPRSQVVLGVSRLYRPFV
ncbi:unnamed protein product, partial [Auanema sp. JU1783]